MKVKKKYTFADFSNHAVDNINEAYEAISDSDFCEFGYKKSTSNGVVDLEGYIIRVGNYFYAAGAQQSVWARPTGLVVKYYHGPCNSDILTPIEEHYINRIYFTDPFCFIAGPQNMRMNKFRYHGRSLVETMVNYLFLNHGYLVCVNNVEGRDLLGEFEQACSNYQDGRERYLSGERMKKKRIQANEEDQATARRFEKGKRADVWGGTYTKQEPTDEMDKEYVGTQFQNFFDDFIHRE